MELLEIDSDQNYSVFPKKYNRNLGNNSTISIGISEEFHNTCSGCDTIHKNRVGSDSPYRRLANLK